MDNDKFVISSLKSENKALHEIIDSLKNFILKDGEMIESLKNELKNMKDSKKCLLCECSKDK